MVNIFGGRGKMEGVKGERGPIGPVGKEGPAGSKGEQGERGTPGRSGVEDICRWMPSLALNEFRKSEACCLLLADPKKDLLIDKRENIVKWFSKSKSKHDAVALRASKHVRHISEKQNALIFNNSLYLVEDVILSLYEPHSYVCVCVTYQIDGESDQVIISNYDDGDPDEPFRAISASSKEIRIWGTKTRSSYIPIEHVVGKNEWTTLLVEWSNINDNRGMFILNGKENGVFTGQDVDPFMVASFTIGGRYGDSPQSLKGAIGSLEIYIGKETPKHDDGVPDALKKLIIQNQMVIAQDNYEPPVKKSKKDQSGCI